MKSRFLSLIGCSIKEGPMRPVLFFLLLLARLAAAATTTTTLPAVTCAPTDTRELGVATARDAWWESYTTLAARKHFIPPLTSVTKCTNPETGGVVYIASMANKNPRRQPAVITYNPSVPGTFRVSLSYMKNARTGIKVEKGMTWLIRYDGQGNVISGKILDFSGHAIHTPRGFL
jgi:hypothetical protein